MLSIIARSTTRKPLFKCKWLNSFESIQLIVTGYQRVVDKDDETTTECLDAVVLPSKLNPVHMSRVSLASQDQGNCQFGLSFFGQICRIWIFWKPFRRQKNRASWPNCAVFGLVLKFVVITVTIKLHPLVHNSFKIVLICFVCKEMVVP